MSTDPTEQVEGTVSVSRTSISNLNEFGFVLHASVFVNSPTVS